MGDDTEDVSQPQGPMQEFASLPWADDAKPWAQEVATRINDYDQRKALADANDAAGANLVSGLDRFRQGLVKRTEADPHFVHTALDLVPPTIAGIVNNHPGLDDDTRQEHHDAIVGDIQNQVALASVQSMAERNAAAAHDLMGDSRISGLLSDEDKQGLSSYIDMQHVARNADAAAQQQRRAQALQDIGTAATITHAEDLYDPQTDTPNFKPGWAQRIMADEKVAPADKAALLHLYGRMQTNGDIPESNPIMVQRALAGEMDHRAILGEAGSSLRLADALDLTHTTLPLSTADRARFSQVADTIDQARAALYGPNGENGAAGHLAWSRFVNWMMPTLRMGGADMANPDAHPLNWLHRFMPTGDDVVPEPPEKRKPLKEIFG